MQLFSNLKLFGHFVFWQPEHQQLIVDAGALPHLVTILKKHKGGQSSRALIGAIRRAADAITNLAHENSRIKSRVRFVNLPILDATESSM